MDADQRRRDVLKHVGAAGGLAAVAGCAGSNSESDPATDTVMETTEPTTEGASTTEPCDGRSLGPKEPIDVRGAMYLPARDFTYYQMWADYDEAVIERDLGYAREVNLNSIRTWASYEHWAEAPAAHERRLDHLLRAADERDMTVLLSLFEGNGVWPTEANLTDRDLFTGLGTRSPGDRILQDRSRWDGPREFVERIATEYGDDERLVALEVMNEPHWDPRTRPFARTMFETLARNRGSVPLTVGATSMVNNATYLDWGVDALQFHYNFPRSRESYREFLLKMQGVADAFDGPAWLTEWQQVRKPPAGPCPPNDDHTYPNYASLAPTIHRSGFGNFLWSLMVKPAYLPPMRGNGVLNGLFHEDGAVWSLDDARTIKAMSGEASVESLTARQQWPDWASEIKERACQDGS